MNYLGHAVLSFSKSGLLAGNLAGDYIKGSNYQDILPKEIARGVRLHRFIDSFTDSHAATLRASILFREKYRRYAPAIVDILMDHFLANDPIYFTDSQQLKTFSTEVYLLVEKELAQLPARFQTMFPYMKDQDWLYGYRQLRSMDRALQGLQQRAQHLGEMRPAYETFIGHYYTLNQCYFELMDDLVPAVKIELSENP